MSAPPPVRHSRAEVEARAIREHRELDALARRLRPAEWDLLVPRRVASDPWTVKDAFAHVVFWKSWSARVIRGERPPEVFRGLHAHRVNRIVWADWRDASVDAVLAWHERVQRDVLAAIDGRGEAWFGSRPRSPFWPADFESHSAEHRLRDIEAALNAAAPVRSPRWSAGSASEVLSTSA